MGGFTQIYPLAEDNPRQAVYEQLIRLEVEASGNGAMSEFKRKDDEKEKGITRRNTEKHPKLPSIASTKDTEPKENLKKPVLAHRVTDLSLGSKPVAEDENGKLTFVRPGEAWDNGHVVK